MPHETVTPPDTIPDTIPDLTPSDLDTLPAADTLPAVALPPTPTHPKIEIAGFLFETPIKYFEGHRLSEAEASALEQTRRENMRNNFSKVVKRALEEAKGDLGPEGQEALQEQFAKFSTSYTFSRTTIKSALDPVEKKAYEIASEMLSAALAAHNIKKSLLQEGAFDARVGQILASQPEIYLEAKARIERSQLLAADLIL